MLVLFLHSKEHDSTGWGTDQACGDQAILFRRGFLPLIMAFVCLSFVQQAKDNKLLYNVG